MTRRSDDFYFTDPRSEEQYSKRHLAWPQSLAEKDAEDARTERIRQQAEERARRRQGVSA